MIGIVTVEISDRIIHVRTQNIGSSLSSCSSFYPLFPLFILPYASASSILLMPISLLCPILNPLLMSTWSLLKTDSYEAIIWQVTSLC